MIALILAAAAVAPAPTVDACAVAAAPRDYVGRKFAIRTTLTMGRHDSLLNYPSDCAAIRYRTLPDSQARQALEHILEVMIGVDYGRRFKTRTPLTLTSLQGLTVSATGTMFCPSATGRCEMQVTGLEQVVYPANFPKAMVPADAGWAGP
ncbi:hypothetical protein [Caulobacter sp. UNC358MFTsu5.1]|uniref:hypothetical protein n=1 Tax=Caulobacter sp. UNC358MFTsu5.1 TaxID=1449049 RepID=UPI0004A6ED7E|nr:hypothetical protein [Caulobacter sp. UNC358MFTsu5.1]